jgi:hypothetical protein
MLVEREHSMSTHTQPTLPFSSGKVQQRRDSKRAQIEAFFGDNIGLKFSSDYCHTRWGSAFRTRVSEINRDEFSSIRILNATDEQDHSQYWAVTR